MQEIEDTREPITKIVKPCGDGGHVVLPKRWVGKTIKVEITDSPEVNG